MTKSQHKRTAAASMFQNGISRNTKCAVRDGFRRDSHICDLCVFLHAHGVRTNNTLKYMHVVTVHVHIVVNTDEEHLSCGWHVVYLYSAGHHTFPKV